MICLKCNYNNPNNAKYCMNCGKNCGNKVNRNDDVERYYRNNINNTLKLQVDVIKLDNKSKPIKKVKSENRSNKDNKLQNPNQAVNIKVSEEFKCDLESFKTLRNISY